MLHLYRCNDFLGTPPPCSWGRGAPPGIGFMGVFQAAECCKGDKIGNSCFAFAPAEMQRQIQLSVCKDLAPLLTNLWQTWHSKIQNQFIKRYNHPHTFTEGLDLKYCSCTVMYCRYAHGSSLISCSLISPISLCCYRSLLISVLLQTFTLLCMLSSSRIGGRGQAGCRKATFYKLCSEKFLRYKFVPSKHKRHINGFIIVPLAQDLLQQYLAGLLLVLMYCPESGCTGEDKAGFGWYKWLLWSCS